MPSQNLTLTAGSNPISTVVTSQSGAAGTPYVVTVTSLSNIATLSTLTTTAGAFSFSPNTFTYSGLSVPATTPSVTVTPTVTVGSNATIQVNGVTLGSGSTSAALPLVQGLNIIRVVVTSQDQSVIDTYTLNVTQTSSIASLSNLVLSAGTLSPAFSSGTLTGYTATVNTGISTIKVTPTSNAAGTITVNGTTVTSGSLSQAIALATGSGNVITIAVKSSDNSVTNSYIVTVTRAEGLTYAGQPFSFIAGTSVGTLNPTATDAPTSYSGTVPAGLTLNPNGSITGIPTVAAVSTPYFITANYAGGLMAIDTVNITVAAPTLSYPAARDSPIMSAQPSQA